MRRLPYLALILVLAIISISCSLIGLPSSKSLPTTVPRVSTNTKVEGKVLFVRAGNIWMWDNGSQKEITKGGHDTQPSWFPEGTAYAYVKQDESRSDIMVANAATGHVRALSNSRLWGYSSGWVYRPTWSPDGKKIAYVSDEGTWDLSLWTMNADGTGRTRIANTAAGMGGIDSPTWSPNGKQIAVASYRSGIPQVWVYTLASGKWQQITKAANGAYDPRWSPAGNRIAFVLRDGSKHYIWVADVDGENGKQLTSDGEARSPTWSFDGEYLAYISTGGGSGFDIWALKLNETDKGLATSEPIQLTKGLEVDPGAGLSWLK